MDLSAIEVIVEIARTGSISKAAQNLFISQPGVSKILKKFEEDVGIQIFERISTGVRPTPMGQKFIEGAQDIMDQVDQRDGIYDATRFGPLCSQHLAFHRELSPNDPYSRFYYEQNAQKPIYEYSENGLNLNIWASEGGKDLPVAVFIHGGSLPPWTGRCPRTLPTAPGTGSSPPASSAPTPRS